VSYVCLLSCYFCSVGLCLVRTRDTAKGLAVLRNQAAVHGDLVSHAICLLSC
jgi:hypothetical protein